MKRRAFLQWPAAALAVDTGDATPSYRVVTRYKTQKRPVELPGRVVQVASPRSIDPASGNANAGVVREMMDRGMCALTGAPKPGDAWRQFFEPRDVVGIKVNCSGAPNIMSHPLVVAEIVRNLAAAGVAPQNIFIYERFPDQLDSVNYAQYLDAKPNILAIEAARGSIRGYDPRTYVEVNFFGEEDTRSNMIRLVTERFTKIVNVPNMKDHGASGVTGCLKNIAYGNFSNVARSHAYEKTNTKTCIGTLAATEPLRSKTVLHIMDGLKGVWQGGPFLHNPRFGFYPQRILFGTDPVAIDRLLIDVIEEKRKQEGAPSVWDRSRDHLFTGRRSEDPMKNRYIREPGHIEYAAGLGLGVYDRQKIRLEEIAV